MRRLDTLQDLLIDQLQEIYNAELLVAEALPKVTHIAASIDLKQALKSHLQTTQGQIQRLQNVFQKLGISPDNRQSDGIQGLLKEQGQIINRQGDPAVKDAAIISATQRVEHYEISGYGAVRTYARELGYNDIADLLQETLDEESEIDKQLTSLAKGGFFSPGINEEAPK